MRSPDLPPRGGFALPLAILALVALSLAVALMIDGAVAAFRAAGAEVQSVRAAAVAETALASAMQSRFDTIAGTLPPGTVLGMVAIPSPDSGVSTVQLLTPPMVRIVVTVRSTAGGVRVFVGRVVLGRLARDSVSGSEVRIIPIGPLWWAPIS